MQQYTLTQSYNSGTIDSNGTAGGIIGYARLDLNINNCYKILNNKKRKEEKSNAKDKKRWKYWGCTHKKN